MNYIAVCRMYLLVRPTISQENIWAICEVQQRTMLAFVCLVACILVFLSYLTVEEVHCIQVYSACRPFQMCPASINLSSENTLICYICHFSKIPHGVLHLVNVSLTAPKQWSAATLFAAEQLPSARRGQPSTLLPLSLSMASSMRPIAADSWDGHAYQCSCPAHRRRRPP